MNEEKLILTDREMQFGICIITCKCCGNKYKTHALANACKYSLTPGFGCQKCLGILPATGAQTATSALRYGGKSYSKPFDTNQKP